MCPGRQPQVPRRLTTARVPSQPTSRANSPSWCLASDFRRACSLSGLMVVDSLCSFPHLVVRVPSRWTSTQFSRQIPGGRSFPGQSTLCLSTQRNCDARSCPFCGACCTYTCTCTYTPRPRRPRHPVAPTIYLPSQSPTTYASTANTHTIPIPIPTPTSPSPIQLYSTTHPTNTLFRSSFPERLAPSIIRICVLATFLSSSSSSSGSACLAPA